MESAQFRYRGARALVLLHERFLREFIEHWKRAVATGVKLPATDDADYLSLFTLLRHVLRASRGYMTWMCDKLELADPGIDPTPEAVQLEDMREVERYVEHLLDKWRTPLTEVPEERFNSVFTSRWRVDYCIDAMLEHAVMHPIRHSFQLGELMAAQGLS